MNKPSYEALKKRVRELEHDSLERRRIEAELLAQQQTLKAQNITLVRKSIDLSDVKRELEDKNYDLERVQLHLQESLAALRESEARFRSLVETTSDWIWEINSDVEYIYASPKVKDLLGYEPREIVGKTPFDLMPSEEARRVEALFKPILASGQAFFGLENRNLHKGGSIVWIETSGVPIFDVQGRLCGYRGIDRDITDRKHAQDTARKQLEFLQTLMDTIPNPVFHKDRHGRYTGCNKAFEEFIGRSSREIEGKTVFDVAPKEIAKRYYEKDQELFRSPGRQSYEWKIRTKTGQLREVIFDKATFLGPDGSIGGLIGVISDITARKQAEEKLRQSEERYRSVVENIGIGVALISPNMEILALNNQMKKWFPTIDETLRPICYKSFNNPPSNEVCSYCPTHKTFVDGGLHEAITETPRGNSTKRYWIVSSPIKDKDGNVVSAIEMVEDITERKRAEEELRESEERFRQLSEASFEAIVVHEEGVVLRANDQFYKMFGYEPEELLGKQAFLLTVAPESLRYVKERLTSATTEPFEFVGIRKDGARFSVESRLRTMDYEGRKVRVAVMRDVTVRRQFEEQLVAHREKLQFLASELSLAEERERRRVAAEVHDHIGQNLAFSKMKLTELRASSPKDILGTVEQIIEMVDQSIQDVRALVSDLGSPVLYELGFVPAMEWLVQRMEKRHGIAVDLEKETTTKPLSEELKVLLFQSVRELLINVAKHSQTQKAKVCVSVEGSRIVVTVEDEGIGFDTTQRGTSIDKTAGFGLFSIQERLEPFGGTIAVKSRLGRGTRVTLVAPLENDHPARDNGAVHNQL